MSVIPYRSALIIGVGPGISGSLTRQLRANGLNVVIASRHVERLVPLARETGAIPLQVDASDPAAVERLFKEADRAIDAPEVIVYNPSGRARGPLAQLDIEEVQRAVSVTALGAFTPSSKRRGAWCPPGRRNPSHRRDRGRKGICTFRGLRHGQVRLARPRAERGA